MVKIVDHAYEPESVIQSNQAKIMRALERNEKVIVLHSEGFVHGRLAGIPGVEYKVLKGLPKRKDLAQKANMPSEGARNRDAEFLARFDEEYEAFVAAYEKNNGTLESSGS